MRDSALLLQYPLSLTAEKFHTNRFPHSRRHGLASSIPARSHPAVTHEQPHAGGGARRLSADAPVFDSPAIDYYAPHHPFQHQQMHVLQVVGGGGGAGRDSSSDGSANGQPNRRVSASRIADSGSVFSICFAWRFGVATPCGQISRSDLRFMMMLMGLGFFDLSLTRSARRLISFLGF